MSESIWDKFDKTIDVKALAKEIKEAEANGGTRNFKDVPYGNYEVEVNKIEFLLSKKGQPMLKVRFKVIEGEYKGSSIFMNQVLSETFQFHIANDILRALVQKIDGFTIQFECYNQYRDMVMDVFEAIDGKFEYALSYKEDKKGFSTFEITEVFVLE